MYTVKTTGRFMQSEGGYAFKHEFVTLEESAQLVRNLMKAHRSFDVYKDGKLVGTGDETGLWTIGKHRQRML